MGIKLHKNLQIINKIFLKKERRIQVGTPSRSWKVWTNLRAWEKASKVHFSRLKLIRKSRIRISSWKVTKIMRLLLLKFAEIMEDLLRIFSFPLENLRYCKVIRKSNLKMTIMIMPFIVFRLMMKWDALRIIKTMYKKYRRKISNWN